MITKLPFLKNRRLPRIATEPEEQKLINASSDEHVDDHCVGELMDAISEKDATKFRYAIQALVLNMFDGDADGT